MSGIVTSRSTRTSSEHGVKWPALTISSGQRSTGCSSSGNGLDGLREGLNGISSTFFQTTCGGPTCMV